jgi:hypothetical protein
VPAVTSVDARTGQVVTTVAQESTGVLGPGRRHGLGPGRRLPGRGEGAPSHPATSQLCFDLLAGAVRETRAPEGTVGIVHGGPAGTDLVAHPAIRAVGFAGSLRGGRALFEVANARPDPIPFYAEMGSLNPLVVTPTAAGERAASIAEGYVASSLWARASSARSRPSSVGRRSFADTCGARKRFPAHGILSQ